MKTVRVYEFNDLSEEQRKNVLRREVAEIVEGDIDALNQEVFDGDITEEEFYSELGCSKSYAESTAWFVPSCYYDKHREMLDIQARESAASKLYNKWGFVISVADDDIKEDKA